MYETGKVVVVVALVLQAARVRVSEMRHEAQVGWRGVVSVLCRGDEDDSGLSVVVQCYTGDYIHKRRVTSSKRLHCRSSGF
ncbi:hypothetical protein E2C01_039164 [Portunus trituberculatus]|uniref:Uncharacterized protein n=1 Tax=Portunus trituberculatus TaxID=210409 RepID=A0A5B7FIX5_PORTR|nr:hypothetical protein [Portunus trituberculatus]